MPFSTFRGPGLTVLHRELRGSLGMQPPKPGSMPQSSPGILGRLDWSQMLADSGAHVTPNMQPVTPRSPAPTLPNPSPAATSVAAERCAYLVADEVWNKLPPEVKTAAVTEFSKKWEFLDGFDLKVLPPKDFPQAFHFTNAVVAVTTENASGYFERAMRSQQYLTQEWASSHIEGKFVLPKDQHTPSDGDDKIGMGGNAKQVLPAGRIKMALAWMAGVVNIDDAIAALLDELGSARGKQLKALPNNGKDLSAWPKLLPEKPAPWQPLVIFGEVLGRMLAHEARHEFIGEHSDGGLGQASPQTVGSKPINFSDDDKRAITQRLKELERKEKESGCTLVPIFSAGKAFSH